MRKNIESASHELKSLQVGVNVIAENRTFALQEEIQSNTKNLEVAYQFCFIFFVERARGRYHP